MRKRSGGAFPRGALAPPGPPAIWVGALDGGGTKTASALADRHGTVLVLDPLPGCNPQDGPGWEPVLRGALRRVTEAEGGLAAAVLGLPGHGEVPEHDAAALALAGEALACPWEAMNDVALAHLGAFAGDHGVLVLSGTGSMAVARGPGGFHRVGGWGDVLGDEGSAWWIGREALALAARALDGREPGAAAFARALCDRLGPEAVGPFAPLAWLVAQGGTLRTAAARAATAVDALAEGYAEAAAVLAAAAGHLAGQARTAAALAGLSGPSPWVPAGGAFGSPLLREAMTAELGAPSAPRLTALGGGLLCAATLAGWSPDAAWAARVDAGLNAYSTPSSVTAVPP